MDVKEAKALMNNKKSSLKTRLSYTDYKEILAKGFLDALAQVRETGVVEDAKPLFDLLNSTDGCIACGKSGSRHSEYCEVAEFKRSLAKLTALLGEKDGRE
jgi:hypothetical protein